MHVCLVAVAVADPVGVAVGLAARRTGVAVAAVVVALGHVALRCHYYRIYLSFHDLSLHHLSLVALGHVALRGRYYRYHHHRHHHHHHHRHHHHHH